MSHALLPGLAGLFVCVAALQAQTTLSTLYTAGNSLNSPGSVMFDATVLDPGGIVVTSIDVSCENSRNGPIGSLFQIDVYRTAAGGTYVGNQSVPGAWTKIATGTGTSLAQGTPTPVDVTDFFLPPGRHGLAINFVIPSGSLGTAFAYTNGNGTNQTYVDAHLQLDLGSSGSGVFGGSVYNPRVWNGGITYEAGTNAAYGPYGSGCSGGAPLGEPVQTPAPGTGVPRLGALWELDFTNLDAQPGVGILAFGMTFQTWGPWSLPLDLGGFGMPGCTAFVPPDTNVFFVHLGSTHRYSGAFPAGAAFAGIVLGTQALFLDPTATNPLGASITNLCAGRIGN